MSWKEFCEDNNIMIAEEAITSRDSLGAFFTTITSGGVKEPAARIPRLYASQEDAWQDFETHLLQWLAGRRRVHLRCPGVLRDIKLYQDKLHEDWEELQYYFVYCRLTAY